MGKNLIEMRKFNGKRKFRAAVKSVIAVNKLTNFLVSNEMFRFTIKIMSIASSGFAFAI